MPETQEVRNVVKRLATCSRFRHWRCAAALRCEITYRVGVSNLPVGVKATTEHKWPDVAAGPWLVTLTWHIVDGRPECAGLTIEGGNDGVLTAGVLRKLPVADWIAEDRVRMLPRSQPTVGLRKSTVERLRAAADVYQRAIADGRPPTKAVAEHYGITHGGASNLVARARTAGLLPPTSPGVPTA
jgi:hypothetical protein